MSKLYKNGDKYYKMTKPVGYWTGKGYKHYVLWQTVKCFLWIFFIPVKKQFWLDMYGFEKV